MASSNGSRVNIIYKYVRYVLTIRCNIMKKENTATVAPPLHHTQILSFVKHSSLNIESIKSALTSHGMSIYYCRIICLRSFIKTNITPLSLSKSQCEWCQRFFFTYTVRWLLSGKFIIMLVLLAQVTRHCLYTGHKQLHFKSIRKTFGVITTRNV